MDFSSANVPISRETWAPQSPPRNGDGPRHSGGGSHRDSSSRADPSSNDRDVRMRSSGGYDDAPRADRRSDDRGGERGYDRDREARRDRDGPAPYAPPPPRRGAPPQAEPNSVLGVFGLSIRTTQRDLEDEFSRHGDVVKVTVVYDQRTDRSRGFGFITMASIEDAKNAIEKLNGYNLHGRNIRVDYSATQKPHAPTPGQYMGEKRPVFDDRYSSRPPPPGDRYDRDDRYGRDDRDRRYDDRRGGGRSDDRDRYDRDPRSRRDQDDPYGGRSRRDDDRAKSPPRRRYSVSPDRSDRRPPPRDYDAPPSVEAARY